MVAVPHAAARNPGQTQICFVKQRRRLQRVIDTLMAQMLAGHAVQLLVDQRQKFFQRLLIAGAPLGDQIVGSLIVQSHAPGRLGAATD